MAAVPVYKPGAGGKIVTNRRRQRLAATPYDRPLLPPPPSENPNWFTGVLFPSARALASGAGKILSSAIFSDSESSSEDIDSGSEDDIHNVNEHGSPYDPINALNEEKLISSELVQHGRESLFAVQRTETKTIIERLIMQESFSREECDRLIKVINSRVIEWSPEAGEKITLAYPIGKLIDHEDDGVASRAVLEAQKWLQEKKAGSSSVFELAHGTFSNSTAFDHIESGVGSPVEMARSYMRDRPPWASPKEYFELRTPLTTKMMLFKEVTPYSFNDEDLSSSKRRNSLASGSWNFQEELRKVRSKAIDEMLRTPPAKIDSTLFSVAPTRDQSAGAVKVVSAMDVKTSEPHPFLKTKFTHTLKDAGVSSDPTLVDLDLRQDCKAGKAPSSNPDVSVSGNNEESQAIRVDGECDASKSPYLAGTDHVNEQHSDPHSNKINGPMGAEVPEFGGRLHVNGISSSPTRSSLEEATVQKYSKYDEENHNGHMISENREMNIINVEGNCELLSEAYTEVPRVNETGSIASDSQIGLDMQDEESLLQMSQPSAEGKPDPTAGKQRGKKPGKNSRRGRGRGK